MDTAVTDSEADEFGAALLSSGVPAEVVALLKKDQLLSADLVGELGVAEWGHLYSKGLSLGNGIKIREVATKLGQPPMVLPPPPNPWFNLVSVLFGFLFALPTVVIGSINEFGPLDSTQAMSLTYRFYVVLIPGALYMLLLVIVIEQFRTVFSTDVLEQRSEGSSLKEAATSNLTNMAVVAALLLTVIIAMIQANNPLGESTALLSQWYQLFLLAAMMPCFAAVVQSSMLLLYIEPLDLKAATNFIGTFIDFFGEPSFAVIFGIGNFVPALALWLYGVYGYSVGLVASFTTILLLRKVALTFLYMSAWDNPTLSESTLLKRKEERIQQRAAATVLHLDLSRVMNGGSRRVAI